jgi:hypothetical protein
MIRGLGKNTNAIRKISIGGHLGLPRKDNPYLARLIENLGKKLDLYSVLLSVFCF